MSGRPGSPGLTLVGLANSVEQSADGWVVHWAAGSAAASALRAE